MRKLRISVFALTLAILILFAACAKNGGDSDKDTSKARPTTAASVEETGEDTSPAQQTPAAFTNDLSGYGITCRLGGAQEGSALYTGWTAQSVGDHTFMQGVMNVAVTEASGAELFRFDVSTSVASYFGSEPDAGFDAALRARRGDTWVFSVNTSGGEEAAVYLYDAAAPALTLLGEYVYVDPCGAYLLATGMDHSGEAGTATDVFDVNGTRVYTYEGTSGYEIFNGYLYIIGANGTLLRVSEDGFNEDRPAFAAEEYASFPRYELHFAAEDPGALLLIPRDGGAGVTCPLEDAARFINGDVNTDTAATGAVSESCDYFTVVLPDAWKGRYTCEDEGDSLSFYYKPENGSENTGNTSTLLFSIYLFEASDDVESMMFGDSSYEICRLDCSEGLFEVMVYENAVQMFPAEYADDFEEMMLAVKDIENRITPTDPDGEILLFDYRYVTGEYEGTDGEGNTYQVRLYMPQRNVLNMYVMFASADGDVTEAVNGTARMFGGNGSLFWFVPDGDGYASYGDGTLMLTEDGGMLFRMYGEGDGWTNTDGELTLQKTESYDDE